MAAFDDFNAQFQSASAMPSIKNCPRGLKYPTIRRRQRRRFANKAGGVLGEHRA
jgi:hypothetical protein